MGLQESGERSVFLRWPLQILPVQKLAETPAAAAAAAAAAASTFGMQSASSLPSAAPVWRHAQLGMEELLEGSVRNMAVFGFARSGRAKQPARFRPVKAVVEAPGLPVHKRYIDQLTPPGTQLDYQVLLSCAFEIIHHISAYD